MILPIIFTALINLTPIQGKTELGQVPVFRPDNFTHFDVYASALHKAHYNPWTCDYRSESNECELLESDHHSITSHSSTLPPYVQQEFNLINKTTVAPAVLSDMDSKPQESTSNVISTQLNDPNRIDGSMTSDEQTNDPAKVNVTETNKNK
ncbi:hypothetical protein SFRURICE_005707 [Spodoptera frugiperda]|nr:hypothetical protein SFRURICE_005707 [Spodoptera frugiperda]